MPASVTNTREGAKARKSIDWEREAKLLDRLDQQESILALMRGLLVARNMACRNTVRAAKQSLKKLGVEVRFLDDHRPPVSYRVVRFAVYFALGATAGLLGFASGVPIAAAWIGGWILGGFSLPLSADH